MRKIQLGALLVTTFICGACSTASPAAPAATTPPAPAPTIAAAPVATTVLTASIAPTAPAPVATTAPTPTAAAAATGAQVQEVDVRKMGQALAALNSFSMHGQFNSGEGSDVQFMMQFVKPDRQHTTITTGGQTIESITIGSDEYTKTGNSWTKTPSGTDASDQMLPFGNPDELAQSFEESSSNGDTMVKGALDSVDGAQCQTWTITSSGGDSTDACIGVNDNLPRRIHTSDGDIFFSDFNAPLTIQAPI